MVTAKKPTTKKPVTSKAPAKKPTAKSAKPAVQTKPHTEHKVEHKLEHKADHKLGRYSYAVGRRKTSVANVRLFFEKGQSMVNKKTLEVYFGNNKGYIETAHKPLQMTGLVGHVVVVANGGGIHSQAQAIAHGVATAIAKAQPDFRKVLKKNDLLTRDSRMKERKKPGLKRARRGPQWAKR